MLRKSPDCILKADHLYMNNQQSLFNIDRTLANQLWTKTFNKFCKEIWSAEVSTINGNQCIRPRNMCPKCDSRFMKKDLIGTFHQGGDDENELAGWIFICPDCKVCLKIMND